MRLRSLTLYTSQLKQQRSFFQDRLGLPITSDQLDQFTVVIGWTALTFQQTEKAHLYHYCFLIPANQLNESIHWLQARLDLIEIEPGRIVQHFDSWNADSIYFYDGAGNLAEFIVRHDLKNTNDTPFSASSILCVNEIGMATANITALNQQLETSLGSPFWKGDQERFGTNGDLEGLFLLPNHQIKTVWFPTECSLTVAPFEATVETAKGRFQVGYQEETLMITPHA